MSSSTSSSRPDCTHRTTCRLCSSPDVSIVLPMRPTPVADDYLAAARHGQPQPLFPLDLYQCATCGHAQLLDVVNPDILFGHYVYTTSVSLGLTEHFERYAAAMVARSGATAGSLIVEIGSNDGTLLRFFQRQGLRVLGVDPAEAIAAGASASGVPTLGTYFTSTLAAEIRRDHGPAAIVAANNVFAHADELGDVADGIATLLADDGWFVFEVSYLVDIVEKMLFDTIYHEHLCYHSIAPFQRFFRRHGLELVDVERIPSKGGSIRGFVRRAQPGRVAAPIVEEMIVQEARLGIHTPAPFEVLTARLQAVKAMLGETLDGLRREGKTIAGYGASATVTTLVHYFDLGRRLSYLVDDNKTKHGTQSPGDHLEVVPSEVLYERMPDLVVILAWAYADPIIKRHAEFLARGGRFLVPLPAPSVRGANA